MSIEGKSSVAVRPTDKSIYMVVVAGNTWFECSGLLGTLLKTKFSQEGHCTHHINPGRQETGRHLKAPANITLTV